MSTSFPVLTGQVQQVLKIRRDGCGKRYGERIHSHAVVAEVVSWSDQPERDREHDVFSNGWRFYLRTEPLLRLLSEIDRVLIIEVQINRNKRGDRELSHDHRKTEALIYLLHPNGRLETLGQNRRVGTQDRR